MKTAVRLDKAPVATFALFLEPNDLDSNLGMLFAVAATFLLARLATHKE